MSTIPSVISEVNAIDLTSCPHRPAPLEIGASTTAERDNGWWNRWGRPVPIQVIRIHLDRLEGGTIDVSDDGSDALEAQIRRIMNCVEKDDCYTAPSGNSNAIEMNGVYKSWVVYQDRHCIAEVYNNGSDETDNGKVCNRRVYVDENDKYISESGGLYPSVSSDPVREEGRCKCM